MALALAPLSAALSALRNPATEDGLALSWGVGRFESGSKLRALHTLCAVRLRLCNPGSCRLGVEYCNCAAEAGRILSTPEGLSHTSARRARDRRALPADLLDSRPGTDYVKGP